MSWICPKCETENPDRLKVCEVCDSPREISSVDKLKDRLKEKYSDPAYKSFIRYHYSLLESADKGNPIDQYHVGEWFFGRRDAVFSPNNDKIAASWYLAAAKQGHTAAQAKLALCYEEGRGVTQSRDAAIKWYKEAARKGDGTAVQRYLKLKYNDKTYESVIRHRPQLLYDADNDNKHSQFLLGEWFSNHNSQSAYREEAIVWFTKAAKNGHNFAMLKLGECYENGKGVYRNYNEAHRWYKKAAEEGNKSARQKLAESYLYGKMVSKDVAEAIKWFGLAGSGINGADLCNIGYAYDVGEGIRMDKTKAVEYYRKAAEKGDAVAQYNLGVCFENGNGVARDIDLAKNWYGKAASQGHSQAQQCISRINSDIYNQEQDKKVEQFVTSLILGPIYGGMGFYFLAEVLPKWSINIPHLGSDFFPTNLIIFLVGGFVVTYIIEKSNS